MEQNTRNCIHCGNILRGRSDKKFCHDQCRSEFNNKLKLVRNYAYVRTINNILSKNRKIMADVLSSDKELTKIQRNKLNELGFNFKYYTHTYTTKKNAVYHYCYEFGYLVLENDWFLIVKEENKAFTKEKSLT